MGSQTLEILRQGVWASVTGGWFFDPHQEIFTNTFHFYLWIILLCLPFSLYLGAPPSNLVWALYAGFVGVLFAVIKFLNYRLHLMFDGEEFHSEDDQREDSSSTRGISRGGSVRESSRQTAVSIRREGSSASHRHDRGRGGEVIEMEVITRCASADTPDGQQQVNLSPSLPSSLLNQSQHLENNTAKQDSGEHTTKPEDEIDTRGQQKTARFKEISFALEAPTSDDSDNSSNNSPSGKLNPGVSSEGNDEGKDTLAKEEQPQFESITSFKSELSQENMPTSSTDIPNSESKGELSDTLSSLGAYPLPIMESAIFEAQSAPGLTTSDIWKPNIASPKSDGSAMSIASNPCTTLEAVAAALENFDLARKLKAQELAEHVEESKDEFKSEGGPMLEVSLAQGTTPLRQDSENDSEHRPRSISDIVHEIKGAEANVSTEGEGRPHSPTGPDMTSLQGCFDRQNPSTSSQPESLDSTTVNIIVNKDTASTATQTGSLGEVEASGQEGSDLILASRSSHLARQRRHIQRTSARRRRRTDTGTGATPLAGVLLHAMDTAPPQAHVASSHNDTTPGALHCYQDEFGQWQTYMFEGENAMTTSNVPPSHSSSRIRDLVANWETSSSSSTFVVEHSLEGYEDISQIDLQRTASQRRWQDTVSASSLPIGQAFTTTCNTPVEKFSVPHYFKFQIIPNRFIKIKFDRLSLLALMDRNKYIFEALASVVLAVMVAVLGYWLLVKNFFYDFWIFLFCFIIASCQFSLLKSVQPDAASPTHGHNHIVVFSRPVYFCCLAAIVLILDKVVKEPDISCISLYSLPLCTNAILTYTRDFLVGFILGFPLIFLIGLLPQVNTFTMYVLEQIDMHMFGGNAMTSLKGSVISVFRSVLATGFLYGFCYGAMSSETVGSQHVLFSIFSGLLVAISYHLSRTATDPTVLISLFRSSCTEKHSFSPDVDFVDPLPGKLKKTVSKRLQNDLICCVFILIFVFAIHVSTVFTTLQPYVSIGLYVLAGLLGVINHYIWPQLRKPLPWLCFAIPFFKSREHNQYEVRDAAKIMRFEKAQVWLNFIERNFVYPAVFLSALTQYAKPLVDKFGEIVGPAIICVVGLKLLRSAFSDSSRQHLILVFTLLFFSFDFAQISETLPVDYFFMSIFMDKLYELILKIRFIVTYIAPWQITWGSAFHAFAQPFSVPHSAMLFFQAIVSSILSAPLNPVLGSAIFITSYVRPVKFWEKDYNTSRVDHSNTRLSSQLDRNPGSDDNNLNSIFYEHLTRSLQHSLCGDLVMGRWGPVSTGDCFVLASDYLNALVHIIEIGNGLVTFQLRGLEFRGTYCQQREVEAITEGVEDDNGCCCCEPGHLPNMLSLNAAFGQRWLAWQVTSTKYIIEGYSISDNSAASMLQVFDLRKILVTYYVKSVIFYAMRSEKLEQWIGNEALQEALAAVHDGAHVDLDSCFYSNIDEDYDLRQGGISRANFLLCYLDWIQYCGSRRQPPLEADRDSMTVTLCFALCLLARRALGTASQHQSASLESFLYGLHALFKGDFRITSPKDEWVFADVDFLRKVVAPGVRMSLKLHQDHFSSMDDYDDHAAMYEAITVHERNMVISHEGDPAWRQAVLANTPSLLALRHVFDDGADEYKIIMLNKRYLSFRVIKVNRECVRGLWAGQLQELIFLRNRNPERGSIQNAKQALRNIINSSCDQPIGYPIYVSPLTTSYADTNPQLSSIIGGPMSFSGITGFLRRVGNHLRVRCGASCHSGGEPSDDVVQDTSVSSAVYSERYSSFRDASRSTTFRSSSGRLPRTNFASAPVGFRTSVRSTGTPQIAVQKRLSGGMSLTQPQPLSPSTPSEELHQMVRIIDIGQVYDTINMGRRIDVQWPSEYMRERGGKNHWKEWRPSEGLEGPVVHRWHPCHRDVTQRSHVDRTILLVKIDERFVPIAEAGVTEIGYEV